MPPKLLLADDSVVVQRVIALTFAGEGLDVVAVGDGDEAVHRIEQERPDIVLADLSMPGRDGYGVAEYVKRSSALAATTRVVLLTGAYEPVEESRTRELGIDGVLAKPFEPQVAIGLVKRLLAQAPLAPSAPGTWAESGGTESREAGDPAGIMHTAAATGQSGLATDLPDGQPKDDGQMAAASPAQLDDYFKRLDEALSSAGLEPSASVRSLMTGVGHDSSDAETVVVAPPARRPMEPARPAAEGSTMTSDTSGTATPSQAPAGVSLVDAFAALLAVEEGREPDVALPAPVDTAAPQAPAGVDLDALADTVAKRVLQQMTDARVQEIVNARVVEIAERLVRDEIDRIKAEAS